MLSHAGLKVLFLDDDSAELFRVRAALGHVFEMKTAKAFADIPALLKGFSPDIFLVDMALDGLEDSGVRLIPKLRDLVPSALVVVYSSYDRGELVRRAINAGADDYISKGPVESLCQQLSQIYQRAITKNGKGTVTQHSTIKSLLGDVQVLGLSMNHLRNNLEAVLKSSVAGIHIYGESGTGKELVADMIEAMIAPLPMIRVNCAAIPEQLIESELFGHRKGSFTGAIADKKGVFEQAHGGVLFLDEVALLSDAAQAKVLRAIENQEITPVGHEGKTKKIRVKVVSATNERLSELVRGRRFRLDLWQRLTEVEYELAPLRQRREEIPALAEHFAKNLKNGPFILTKAALNILSTLDWSNGNVRELRNCIRAMSAFSIGNELTPMSIPRRFWASDSESPQTKNESQMFVSVPLDAERLNWAQLEDRFLLATAETLSKAQGILNLSTLAKKLELSPHSLRLRFNRLIEDAVINQGTLDGILSL